MGENEEVIEVIEVIEVSGNEEVIEVSREWASSFIDDVNERAKEHVKDIDTRKTYEYLMCGRSIPEVLEAIKYANDKYRQEVYELYNTVDALEERKRNIEVRARNLLFANRVFVALIKEADGE